MNLLGYFERLNDSLDIGQPNDVLGLSTEWGIVGLTKAKVEFPKRVESTGVTVIERKSGLLLFKKNSSIDFRRSSQSDTLRKFHFTSVVSET